MELYGIDAESTVVIQPDHRMSSEEFFRFCMANADWRIEQTVDGVYVELETLTLSRPAGGLTPARFLNGFVQAFPREFTEGLIEGLRQGFPRPR